MSWLEAMAGLSYDLLQPLQSLTAAPNPSSARITIRGAAFKTPTVLRSMLALATSLPALPECFI